MFCDAKTKHCRLLIEVLDTSIRSIEILVTYVLGLVNCPLLTIRSLCSNYKFICALNFGFLKFSSSGYEVGTHSHQRHDKTTPPGVSHGGVLNNFVGLIVLHRPFSHRRRGSFSTGGGARFLQDGFVCGASPVLAQKNPLLFR